MKRLALLAAISLAGCSTNPTTGKSGLDPEKVRLAVMLTCALAPTAAEITKLYTNNPAVQTTEQATALLCAAALPIVKTLPTAPVQ